MQPALAAVLLAALLVAAAPAAAHKIKVFAAVDGDGIAGTLFFSGNTAARGVAIAVLGPDGRIVAETVSDGDGRFRVAIAGPFDHRIVADTGDGHRSEFVVGRDELPAAAAAPGPFAVSPSAAAQPVAPPQPAATPLPLASDTERLVEQAVARQLAPLREQLDAFEERVLWRDVLGGIGYIVGLCGLAAWLMSRHRRAHDA